MLKVHDVLTMAKSESRRGTPTPAVPPSAISFKGPYKGHISLKSNAFAPTCKRAINQQDVVGSLNVHYRKLQSAKSAIDSSTPKTWTLSTKKRDQLKRQAIEKNSKKKSGLRTQSRPVSRNTTGTDGEDFRLDLDEDLANYGVHDHHVARSAPMTPTKAYRPHSSLSAQQHSYRPGTSQSQLYNTSGTYKKAMNGDVQATMTLSYRDRMTPRQQPGDVLDKRPGKFTVANKPHTPRTLKTTATSRIAQSKNYNSPKKNKANAKELNEMGVHDGDHRWEERNARPLHSAEQLKEVEDREDQENATLKRAEDHLRWVEEQAIRVQSLEIDDIEDDELRHSSSPYPARSWGGRMPLGGKQDLNVSYGNQSLRSELATMTYRTPEQVSKRMQEEEEELRYLEFVTDVTNDVLNRGIYTNRVLKQVFESHIDRNKARLDEGRMRHLMKQLQEDLAIPDTDEPGEAT